jgi:formiminoglutamate deiminase
VTAAQYLCEHAWLSPEVGSGVLVEVADGQFTSVRAGVTRAQAPAATYLEGLTLPGLANVHSHAFHRALRGRTQAGGAGSGSFWTWREQMYAVAQRLTPDTYYALARAAYAEMALAGATSVGEFHYLHHGPGGVPYADPNAMAAALVAAAQDAGVRLTLLDACYLAGGVGVELAGPQLRFSDGDAASWAARVERLAGAGHDPRWVRVGAAVHSVRAVPADQLGTVAGWASQHQAPLHVHLSEQVAENEACLAAYGRTPTQVLADAGVLSPRATAVHATHLTSADVGLLGGSGTGACFCPTTERDLADGVGPARALADAGSALSLGSDSHAVVDLFEEARALELNERLVSGRRGHFAADELLAAATASGQAALGWGGAGAIAVGAVADLVTVRLDSVRTAGGPPTAETAVFAAGAADVTHVLASGRVTVADACHARVPDVGRALAEAIAAVASG